MMQEYIFKTFKNLLKIDREIQENTTSELISGGL